MWSMLAAEQPQVHSIPCLAHVLTGCVLLGQVGGMDAFPKLRLLYLADNNLGGALPQWGEGGRMTSLVTLRLQQQAITGQGCALCRTSHLMLIH